MLRDRIFLREEHLLLLRVLQWFEDEFETRFHRALLSISEKAIKNQSLLVSIETVSVHYFHYGRIDTQRLRDFVGFLIRPDLLQPSGTDFPIPSRKNVRRCFVIIDSNTNDHLYLNYLMLLFLYFNDLSFHLLFLMFNVLQTSFVHLNLLLGGLQREEKMMFRGLLFTLFYYLFQSIFLFTPLTLNRCVTSLQFLRRNHRPRGKSAAKMRRSTAALAREMSRKGSLKNCFFPRYVSTIDSVKR